ncbi:hypothetical protein HPB47_014446 [Ixodes persulcatus]|uniref:Uncharacterized protein n=1 Tax=Ixodes persulcatus TaxID=34615 RepID=A0AC60R0P5_IXOPE|nr:hypothetical protein HPB47_014446 [Ixodes persulcatus]
MNGLTRFPLSLSTGTPPPGGYRTGSASDQRLSRKHRDDPKQTQNREPAERDEDHPQSDMAHLTQLQTRLVEAVMDATLASGDRQAAQKMLKASECLGPTNTVGQPHNNTETNPETTEGLIIRPSDPSIEVPFQHVRQILNRCFTPHEIGLDKFQCTKIREGAIITSTNLEALENLERQLHTNTETAGQFETRLAEKRLPQISVTAVDPDIEEEELKTKIIQQNRIEAHKTDIKLVHTTTPAVTGRETRMATSYPTDARPAQTVMKNTGQHTPHDTHSMTFDVQASPPNRREFALGQSTTNI